jgi:hypothetical protein
MPCGHLPTLAICRLFDFLSLPGDQWEASKYQSILELQEIGKSGINLYEASAGLVFTIYWTVVLAAGMCFIMAAIYIFRWLLRPGEAAAEGREESSESSEISLLQEVSAATAAVAAYIEDQITDGLKQEPVGPSYSSWKISSRLDSLRGYDSNR